MLAWAFVKTITHNICNNKKIYSTLNSCGAIFSTQLGKTKQLPLKVSAGSERIAMYALLLYVRFKAVATES